MTGHELDAERALFLARQNAAAAVALEAAEDRAAGGITAADPGPGDASRSRQVGGRALDHLDEAQTLLAVWDEPDAQLSAAHALADIAVSLRRIADQGEPQVAAVDIANTGYFAGGAR